MDSLKKELQEKLDKILHVFLFAKDAYNYTEYFHNPETEEESSFINNSLTIEFREPFKPRRGRINCSLNDNGKWRWFGVQFPIKEN